MKINKFITLMLMGILAVACTKIPFFQFAGNHSMQVRSLITVMGTVRMDTSYTERITLSSAETFRDLEGAVNLTCPSCNGEVELNFVQFDPTSHYYIYEGHEERYTYALYLNYLNDSILLKMVFYISPAGRQSWNMTGKR